MADLFLLCPVPRRSGTLQSELIPNSPKSYVFYYYLHTINEKTETYRGYMT